MTWYEALNGKGFQDWLLRVAGGNRVPQGRRLDPFATSMRVFKFETPKLQEVRQSENLTTGNDPGQNIVDLKAAGLVDRVGDGVKLTRLGTQVLDKWIHYGVGNESDDDELPRCLIVVIEGLRLALPEYRTFVAFWNEIRKQYTADSLLASPSSLYLISYLNQEHNGFNPWKVLIAANPNGVLNQAIDWADLKANTPNISPQVSDAIDNLKRRVDDAATRATGRLAFCRALELATSAPDLARVSLSAWHLSDRTKTVTDRILAEMQSVSEPESPVVRDSLELIRERMNVVFYGPPGTGKTHTAFAVASQWEEQNGEGTVFRVTFHPSYGYEDFVEGYRPDPDQPGVFHKKGGILREACEAADGLVRVTPPGEVPKRILLLIDEINRGDISRIFGELITYIEPDKRNKPIMLAQSPGEPFFIPENLSFLGTMNTADKSISLLDIALRRRFAFLEFPPQPAFFETDEHFISSAGGVDLGALLVGLNRLLRNEGVDIDRAIGHALLAIDIKVADPVRALRRRFEFDIHPLIVEYCYTDRARVARILGNLVDDEGRFRSSLTLSSQDFIAALRVIAGQPALVEEVPEEGPTVVTTDPPKDSPPS